MFGLKRSFTLGADVISCGCSCSSFKRSVDRYEKPASETICKQAFSVFALCYTRCPVLCPSSSERVSHHQLYLNLLINCRTDLQCDTWDSANIYANAFDLFCVFLSVTKRVFYHRLLGTQRHHRFFVETAHLLRHKRMENVFKVIYMHVRASGFQVASHIQHLLQVHSNFWIPLYSARGIINKHIRLIHCSSFEIRIW